VADDERPKTPKPPKPEFLKEVVVGIEEAKKARAEKEKAAEEERKKKQAKATRARGVTEAVSEEEKETQKDALIRFGSRAKLWHDPDQQGFASFVINGHTENHALRTKGFKGWLLHQYYTETKKAPGAQALEEALRVLEAKAMFDGPERQTFVRLAGADGRVYLDIGDESWRAIEISASGWGIVAAPPVAFIRSRGLRPLPFPESGGSIEDLRGLLNFKDDEDFMVFVAVLIGYFRPDGPYIITALNGEQGAAKSSAARIMRRLIDPNAADTRSVPKDETDLLIAARNGWIVNLDNLSRIPDWLSDALCRIATGAGFGARQLYTNTEEVLFEAKRPIVINGIPHLATRSDLADRCVTFVLPTIAKRARIPESTFWESFDDQAGRILGVLLDCVVRALGHEAAVRDFAIENEVELPRMADAAIWAEAAAPALGWSPGVVLKLFLEKQVELQQHIADADLVTQAIQRLMEDYPEWEGNSTELLEALRDPHITGEETIRMREWPKAANVLSNRVRRAAPGIRMSGVGVAERLLDGRTIWTLYRISKGNDPTDPPDPTSSGASGVSGPNSLPASSQYDLEDYLSGEPEPEDP
jgi:hypothetical protein